MELWGDWEMLSQAMVSLMSMSVVIAEALVVFVVMKVQLVLGRRRFRPFGL